MLRGPKWEDFETILVDEGRRIVKNFSASHPTEVCSFFAFSIDYCFGDVVICLDTYDNGLLYAKRHEARTLKALGVALDGEKGWENAKYYMQRDRLHDFNPQTADFKYPNFAHYHFSEWEDYFGNDELPESPDPIGHIIVLMHKTVEKLVKTDSFSGLKISSPFRIGIEFPRDNLGLLVMKFLNWPSHQGPRV